MASRRRCGDERGLARVGIADQAYIGQQLQFEAVVALLARAAQFVLPGGLVDTGGEVLVATPAAAALGDDDLLVWFLEVVDQLAGVLVVKGRPDWHLQEDGVAVGPAAVGSHAVLAALRLVLGVIAEVDQGIVTLRGDHDDVAATAAVAAGRSAAGNEFFAPEGHAAIAAVAGLDAYLCLIDEHYTTRE